MSYDYDTTIRSNNPGLPGSWIESFTQYGLILSNAPEIVMKTLLVANSQTIKQFQAIGVDASGNLAVAKAADDPGTRAAPTANTLWPIGIATAKCTTDATNIDSDGKRQTLQVMISGHFNIDAIIWDDSFNVNTDTDHEERDKRKIKMFGDLPNPSMILLDVNKYSRPKFVA